ncbi:MAG: hypothetical protein IPL62_07530 [Caulobacteraceae bacterium]|nr:hypothetical protein [Caulobacteraceae bacterium]
MVGFAQTSLDFAVSETARQIRTGQAQTNGVSEAQIRTQLCSELNSFIVMGCDGNLFLDVRRFTSFTDASNSAWNPVQNNQFSAQGMGYQPGAAVRHRRRSRLLSLEGDDAAVRTDFENVSGGERILVSTMMFRNEPF